MTEIDLCSALLLHLIIRIHPTFPVLLLCNYRKCPLNLTRTKTDKVTLFL